MRIDRYTDKRTHNTQIHILTHTHIYRYIYKKEKEVYICINKNEVNEKNEENKKIMSKKNIYIYFSRDKYIYI